VHLACLKVLEVSSEQSWEALVLVGLLGTRKDSVWTISHFPHLPSYHAEKHCSLTSRTAKELENDTGI
jgi:hypothetical protein